MKLSINIDDANYLANKNRFIEELGAFLVSWGYKNNPKRYQNFHYLTEDIVFQIDRVNIDFEDEDFYNEEEE